MHVLKFVAFMSIFLYGIFIDWKLLVIQAGLLMLYYIFSCIFGSCRSKTTTREKMALASWGAPGDPQVFNNLEVNTKKLDEFIEKHNTANPDSKITYTQLALKALGYAFSRHREVNATISFGNLVKLKDIDVNCLVDVGGQNLASMLVRNVDGLTVTELKKQMQGKVAKYKKLKDKDFNKQMGIVASLHSSLISLLLEFTSTLAYSFGLNVGALRIKKRGFGTILLTNCTKMEIYNSFAPLVPFTRAVCVVLLCKPKLRAGVDKNGNIEVQNIMNINVTFDHRYCDGSRASLLVGDMYHFFENLDTLAFEKADNGREQEQQK